MTYDAFVQMYIVTTPIMRKYKENEMSKNKEAWHYNQFLFCYQYYNGYFFDCYLEIHEKRDYYDVKYYQDHGTAIVIILTWNNKFNRNHSLFFYQHGYPNIVVGKQYYYYYY